MAKINKDDYLKTAISTIKILSYAGVEIPKVSADITSSRNICILFADEGKLKLILVDGLSIMVPEEDKLLEKGELEKQKLAEAFKIKTENGEKAYINPKFNLSSAENKGKSISEIVDEIDKNLSKDEIMRLGDRIARCDWVGDLNFKEMVKKEHARLAANVAELKIAGPSQTPTVFKRKK